jgi:nuclear receptor subfamily 1 group I
MKKEFIMSEDDKKKKKLKIEQNRSKRKSKLLNEDDDGGDRKDHLKDNVKKLKLENQETELNSSVEMSPSTSVNSEYSTTDSDFQFPLMDKINLTINNLKTISSTPEFFETISTLTKLPKGVLEIVQNLLSAPKETLQFIQRFMNINPNNDNIVSANDNETIRSMLSINKNNNNNNVECPPENNAENHEDKSYSTILNEIMFDIKSEKQNFQPFKGNSIDSIISEAIKLEYNTSQIAAQFQNHNTYELNEIEVHKIQELLDANSTLLNEPIDENHLSLLPSFIGGAGDDSLESKSNQFIDPVLINVINLTAVCLRRLIKMSKKITAFKRMCQNDQIALLKVTFT